MTQRPSERQKMSLVEGLGCLELVLIGIREQNMVGPQPMRMENSERN